MSPSIKIRLVEPSCSMRLDGQTWRS